MLTTYFLLVSNNLPGVSPESRSDDHKHTISIPVMPPPPPCRQYHQQCVAVEALQGELVLVQQDQEEEKERYSRIKIQMRVRERTQQDIGGLTDTVVGGARGRASPYALGAVSLKLASIT